MTKIKVFMLAVAIAISFAAQANEVARVQNNDGGFIVFTAAHCPQSKEWYSVYGYGSSSNNTISGCFRFADGAFWVRWNHDANIKRYPAEAVTWHPDFVEVVKKNRQTY